MHEQNTIVVGLGFGDEGKGSVVSHLAATRNPNYVIRFSGGPQAAHRVVLADGREHIFANFGSGTLHGVPTILSRFMLVNPFNMMAEADALTTLLGYDPCTRAYVAEASPLVTPLHVSGNQAREIARGGNPHGSCGQGIGETMLFTTQPTWAPYTPLVRDLLDMPVLEKKLHVLRQYFLNQFPAADLPDVDLLINSYKALMADNRLNIVTDTWITRELRRGYNVFEGSQGVLLDEWLGFHPHTTWSTTTAQNAQTLLREAGLPVGYVLGVTRTYTTRHGHGPFPTQFTERAPRYPEAFNADGRWQGAWRDGELDLPLLSYAVRANHGVDGIALTHADVLPATVVKNYPAATTLIPRWDEDLDKQVTITTALQATQSQDLVRTTITDLAHLLELISTTAAAPIRIISRGPGTDQKEDLS